MDTAEARTTTSGAAGGPVYDAFLSYSHAADELLAPRLQAGLQRFAKPWWKRRALRIFRDEASLSANPHLWSSITDALDGSGWFVLLLSPDAAESEWVNREVEYWLDKKNPDRIIPVVTEGEFTWADGHILSDAAPPALYRAFADEPRWVDLRFAHSEEQLDLKNPRFSAAVADVASAIRGVPKDELESEEVRQHRRTVRTAWAATFALVVLVVVATTAALFALDQRNEAEAAAEAEAKQRVEADQQRLAAEEAREAEAEQRVEAEEQRAEALRLADVARSRALAASAINVLDEDPELSVLLALQAAEGADPTFESVSALHEALQSHRTLRTFTWPEEWAMDPAMVGSISPDGRYVAVSGSKHQLAVFDVETTSDEPIWFFELPWPDHAVIVPNYTVDGLQVVATVAWFDLTASPESWPAPPPEVGVYVFDARSGEVINHFKGPDCPFVSLFQTGRFLDAERLVAASAPAAEDCSLDGGAEIWLMDLATGDMALGYEEPVFSWYWGTPASLTEDGSHLSVVEGFTSKVIDLRTGEVTFEAPGGEYALLTRDGSGFLATDGREITAWDVSTGIELWSVESPSNLHRVSFSEDESLVYAGAWDGSVRVWSAETGVLIHELKGHRSWTGYVTMSSDNTRLASFSGDGTVRLWDLTAVAEGEIGGFDLPGYPVLQSGRIIGDQGVILLYRDGSSAFVEPGMATLFDPSTGEIKHRFEGYGGQMVRLSDDGILLAGQPFAAPGVLGPVHIRDVETGEVLVELEDLCTFDNSTKSPGADCAQDPNALGDQVWWLDFSPDRSMLAVSGEYSGVEGVWDVESGQRLTWLSGRTGEENEAVVTFGPDSDFLLATESELTVFDTETWSEVVNLELGYWWWDVVFAPDGRLLFGVDIRDGIATVDMDVWEYSRGPLSGHEGVIRDIAVSSDGSLIASGGDDGFVLIWSAGSGEMLQAIPFGDAAIVLVEFIDDRHLLVIPQGRPALVMTIDVPELLGLARSQVTRGFTQAECTTYHIDPCPTLEDNQTGSA